MPPLATLLANFFVDAPDVAADIAGDSTLSGESVPHTSDGNKVTPLIDGHEYFGAIAAEVAALKAPGGNGKFFYFTNWLISLVNVAATSGSAGSGITAWDATAPAIVAFKLDDGSGGPFPDFIDELAAMAANNVDVRALLWVSPLVLSFQEAAAKSGMYGINSSTLLSAEALRAKPQMDKKVCLNTLAHPLGAMHLKMVVCGDDTSQRAFVSGIDFDRSRADGPTHPNGATFGWHDAGAKIEGLAVQGVYAYLRQLWNEQIGHDQETFRIGEHKVESYVDDTPEVPERVISVAAVGAMHCQILRTGPQMNFSFFETKAAPIGCIKRLITGFKRPSWDSAPNGIFEFRAVLHKAIMHAEKYIYVEDQGFYAQEIMTWINQRLKAMPDLKVIFVHHSDPADGPRVMRITNIAVNENLIAGLGGPPPVIDPAKQVAFYERTDRVAIHAKTWIIDDAFAIIGSANFMRRSLYMDGEISVAVIDEDTTDNNFAIEYRRRLWGEHCGLLTPADRAVLTNLDDAIRIWDPSWFWGGGGVPAGPPVASIMPIYERKNVPFLVGATSDRWADLDMSMTTIEYDQLDGDSRKEY